MTEAKKLALAQRLFFLYFTKHGFTSGAQFPNIKFSGTKIEKGAYDIKKKISDNTANQGF